MHVKIRNHEEEQTTAIFGATDCEFDPELNQVTVWFPREVGNSDCRSFDGVIEASVVEAYYNEQGALETLADLSEYEDTELIVVTSPKYPHVQWAANYLTELEDLGGEFTLISDRNDSRDQVLCADKTSESEA